MAKSNRSQSLETLLTRDSLRNLAGDRSFQRGDDYFKRGCVKDLAIGWDRLSARVSGREAYYVDLWAEGEQLQSSCTCPLGMEGIFCKHCVAVGLTWLKNPEVSAPQPSDRTSPQKPVTMNDVESFLERQEKAVLIQWMLDRARHDADWQQQLLLKVASQKTQGFNLTTFHNALRNAIEVDEFIDWNAVHDYANRINFVLDSIRDIVDYEPEAVVELCEMAIVMLERAFDSVDDSSGYLGAIFDDVQTLHYEACVMASPNPIALARRLFDLYINSGYGCFSGVVTGYADVLGAEGLAEYRSLAEQMWQTFPDRTSRDKSEFNYKRSQVQSILETLAKETGDVEAIVAIKRRDLSSASTYLQIAQLYHQAGQDDRALEWAETGLKSFQGIDWQLWDFIVEAYHRRDRGAEAMALIWQAFEQGVSLRHYQLLKTHAGRVNEWEVWREKALAHIRSGLERAAEPTGRRTTGIGAYGLERDRSILVEIFLWEGEDELAWQEATEGDCSKSLWLTLADRRKLTHPEEVLPIYQREVELLIQQTNNASYVSAINYLKIVRELMMKLDRQPEFHISIAQLQKTYKAKRNFIALLQKQGW
jgi:uncharacterized Zn finger protein